MVATKEHKTVLLWVIRAIVILAFIYLIIKYIEL